MVVVQPLPDALVAASEETEPHYNAWGRNTTKKSITDAIARMWQLRQEIAIPQMSSRKMIEEGRRF
jgi:hypothetical protein